jgi:hypothetical protein
MGQLFQESPVLGRSFAAKDAPANRRPRELAIWREDFATEALTDRLLDLLLFQDLVSGPIGIEPTGS